MSAWWQTNNGIVYFNTRSYQTLQLLCHLENTQISSNLSCTQISSFAPNQPTKSYLSLTKLFKLNILNIFDLVWSWAIIITLAPPQFLPFSVLLILPVLNNKQIFFLSYSCFMKFSTVTHTKLNKADPHIFPHHPLLAPSHSQFHARFKTLLFQKSNSSSSVGSWRFSDHRTWLMKSSYHLSHSYLIHQCFKFLRLNYYLVSHNFMLYFYRHFRSPLSWL